MLYVSVSVGNSVSVSNSVGNSVGVSANGIV